MSDIVERYKKRRADRIASKQCDGGPGSGKKPHGGASKRKEIVDRALKNGEIPLDVAGQLLSGDDAIRKMYERGEIKRDLAGLLLSFGND